MTFELKFSKFDNTPWGFRLTGGSDCNMPLTVVKVSEGSVAEQVGLREHDILVKINGIDTSCLSHDEAHEVISYAGNDFIATVFRNTSNVIEQPTNDFASEPLLLSEPSTLTNDINQVPDHGTKNPNLYKPFSNKTFSDITPLENPLIFSKDFQTIKQKEWKEFSSKQAKMSTKESTNTVCIQQSENIDIREIEQSAKETIDDNIVKTVEIVQNGIIEHNSVETVEKKSNVNDICKLSSELNINNVEKKSSVENSIREESQTIKIDENKSTSELKLTENITVKQEAVLSEVQCKKLEEKNTVNEIYDQSKEVSLEDVKVEAIKAANTLSQQAKMNGIQSFENSNIATVDAFKALSKTMKHKCLSVPCEAVKLQTKSQTDLLLKTFFIHLTDVMVALTQMITNEDSSKCSRSCSPVCMCLSKIQEKKCNIKEENEITVSSKKEEIKMSDIKCHSEVNEVKNEISQSCHTEQVLKEVIDNIQTATGVDVTVNGKDPLEWLADIDEKNSTAIDTKIMQSSEVIESTQVVSNLNTEVINVPIETSKDKQLDIKDTEKVMSPGWDTKITSSVPQTPNTDEYMFRLDIKIKGKLSDCPEESPKVEEIPKPEEHEDLSIVRRPIFTIGDVQIERTINKDDNESHDNNKNKIIMQNSGEDQIASVVLKNKNSDLSLKASNMEESKILQGEQVSEDAKQLYDSESTENKTKSINANTEGVITNITDIKSTLTNMESFSNAATTCTTNMSHSEMVNSEYNNSTNMLSATATNNTNTVLGTANTVFSSIPASGNDFTNDIPASAHNYASSRSFANSQEGVHETVLTSTKEKMELNQEMIMYSNSETSSIIEEAPLQVKTMSEPIRNFATVNNDRQILNIASNLDNSTNVEEEDVGKPGLTDNEISAIISGDANMSREQHVIGLTKVLASHMNRPDDEINTNEVKDMVPIVGFLRDSEVFKALNEENLRIKAERLQEGRKKWTTFLQKPKGPVPFCKRDAEKLEFQEPPYRVNIKKQDRKGSTTEQTSSILTEGLFLVPEVPILIPEPIPQYFEAPEYLADSSFPDLEDTGIPIPIPQKVEVIEENIAVETNDQIEEHQEEDKEVVEETMEHAVLHETVCETEETNDEDLTVEEQLAKVQQQLMALSTLPATIQQTLDLVTKKISKMVTKSTMEEFESTQSQEETQEMSQIENVCTISSKVADETVSSTDVNQMEYDENKTSGIIVENGENNNYESTTVQNEETEKCEVINQECNEMQPEQNGKVEDGQNIHKLRKDLIDELTEEHVMRQVKQRPTGRVGRPRPAFGPLTPQERPIVLPGGRRWRGPRDAFSDAFIAETLSGQAEVIMGKTLGNHIEYIYPPYDERESNCHLVPIMKGSRVNFMKYAKPPVTLDHLKSSDVYKLIHDEEQSVHGIHARQGIVLAESEYREKCRSVTPSSFDKQEMEVN